MNKVTLLGRLGQDSELKVLGNGQSVLKFSLATSESWKDKDSGDKKEKTQWHRCVLWGPRASALAPYLLKGTMIAVEGSIEYGSYEKDDVKHYTTDIKVLNVHFAGGNKKPDGAGGSSEESASIPDSEIPF